MSGTVPQLRFPEFQGSWKAGHAGDAFAKSTAKGSAGLPVYSVTMDRGLVRRDSMERHMADDAADGSNLRAEPNDIVYNTMRMWQGAAGVADTACMVSPAYVVLRPKQGTVSAFFIQRFGNSKMLHSLWAYSHGLTSDRLRLYFDDFAQIPVRLPSSAEQHKIADFLGTADAKLDALRRKKSGLEAFKSGLMQRLFSQELRFTRDDGTEFPEWDQVSFAEIAERSSDKLDPRNVHEGMPVIDLENIESGTGWIIHAGQSDESASLKSVFRTGEVLFGKLRPYLRKFAQPDFEGCCSSEIWVLRGKRVSNDFLFHLIQSSRFMELATISSGSKMPRADWSIISSAEFDVPHPDEQRKIADALSAMDAKIAAVANQITHMETFKKGLLQQMFV
ncbi:restriction endonuclease subunit S [Paracoccus sp. DMF-8]|uniref:restriction endonuclease subunit S n=1 Tax=Paracoccus sp. DMF-8 TaxID=3019445 RepID=UPI0023E3B057|nr:restriction endonuclease subunit S [Paracoccus sp. DMF-8]MDF3608357.1 restriction endonuclease subunit S [Paracoccus sp. DMF-8]